MAIFTYTEAKKKISTINKSVIVSGCFDILHIGHVRFLQEACKLGDSLIILLEGDEFVRATKNREPFHTQKERAEILSALHCIDHVVLLPYFKHEKEYEEMFAHVSPYIVAVSNNDPYLHKKREQVERTGGKIEEIDIFVNNKSTSKILRYFGE